MEEIIEIRREDIVELREGFRSTGSFVTSEVVFNCLTKILERTSKEAKAKEKKDE